MWVAVASLVPSALALAGGLIMLLRWLGRLDRNTEATEELTKAFKSFSDRISLRVDDHEVRIRILESAKDGSRSRQNRS